MNKWMALVIVVSAATFSSAQAPVTFKQPTSTLNDLPKTTSATPVSGLGIHPRVGTSKGHESKFLPVPEPATMLVVFSGCLVAMRKRKKS